MKLRLSQATKAALSVRGITTVAVGAALLLAVQIALSGFANIELVSLLVIIYTLKFKRATLYIVYIFALLEGVIYGFGLWWIMYLYVWPILMGITWLFRKMDSPLGWAVLSGAFGLVFGALCAIPYLFIGGLGMAAAYWISGIPFDLIHCAGNFLLCLILWKPLCKAIGRIIII